MIDEIDVIKNSSYKIQNLESSIEDYKIKLEEMHDLKNQLKIIKCENNKYFDKIIQLEQV